MRWAALALLCFLVPAAAQEENAPRLTADFEETETIPGQALSLRLTVLVPTYMPRPPVWPTFETPNLLVRVASTGPTSQRIGGATWAGVSRRYLITPMVPGEVALPPATVAITYADPATNAPVTATLDAGPFAVTGIVPEGAAGLDPFVAADGLVLEQTLDGDPSAMVPGDSVVRTVTATIRGTPPMFLPPLIAASPVEGVRAYPDEPVLAETSGRGVVSGTRTERVTYVAEGGGAGEIPAVTLDWYDLGSGEITTAAVDGFAIAVDGPPAAAAMAEPRDLRMMALWGAAVLLLLAALALSFAGSCRRCGVCSPPGAPPGWRRRRTPSTSFRTSCDGTTIGAFARRSMSGQAALRPVTRGGTRALPPPSKRSAGPATAPSD